MNIILLVIVMDDKKITKEMLWRLFKETGAIEYYLLYKNK